MRLKFCFTLESWTRRKLIGLRQRIQACDSKRWEMREWWDFCWVEIIRNNVGKDCEMRKCIQQRIAVLHRWSVISHRIEIMRRIKCCRFRSFASFALLLLFLPFLCHGFWLVQHMKHETMDGMKLNYLFSSSRAHVYVVRYNTGALNALRTRTELVSAHVVLRTKYKIITRW